MRDVLLPVSWTGGPLQGIVPQARGDQGDTGLPDGAFKSDFAARLGVALLALFPNAVSEAYHV